MRQKISDKRWYDYLIRNTKLNINPNIIKLDRIDSTNNFAKDIINSKIVSDWTVIHATEQSQGRGQRGNTWQSNPNENLTFSLIISPNIKVEKQFYISKIVSLALLNFFNKYSNNATIKWPNDIYIDDKKIAGILIENYIQANKINKSIIGIGININQCEFDENIPNPISLKQLTNKSFDLNTVLLQIIDEIYIMHQSINNYKLIDNLYNKNLYRLEKETQFKDKNNKIFNAIIIGTNEEGKLKLKINNEIKFFDFQEVRLS